MASLPASSFSLCTGTLLDERFPFFLPEIAHVEWLNWFIWVPFLWGQRLWDYIRKRVNTGGWIIELIYWLTCVNLALEVSHSNRVPCELLSLLSLLFKITLSCAWKCTMDIKLNINCMQFKCSVLHLLIFLLPVRYHLTKRTVLEPIHI